MTEFPTAENGSSGIGRSPGRPEDRSLTPEVDPARWEALVAHILADARPLLEARRHRHTLPRTIAAWRRPVMTASAGLAAAAAATLFLLPGSDLLPVEASLDEIVVPWSVAAWMDGSHTPTVEELVLAMEEYSP